MLQGNELLTRLRRPTDNRPCCGTGGSGAGARRAAPPRTRARGRCGSARRRAWTGRWACPTRRTLARWNRPCPASCGVRRLLSQQLPARWGRHSRSGAHAPRAVLVVVGGIHGLVPRENAHRHPLEHTPRLRGHALIRLQRHEGAGGLLVVLARHTRPRAHVMQACVSASHGGGQGVRQARTLLKKEDSACSVYTSRGSSTSSYTLSAKAVFMLRAGVSANAKPGRVQAGRDTHAAP